MTADRTTASPGGGTETSQGAREALADVLVVDRQARIVAEMLSSMGYEPRSASDCHEGLYAIAEAAPDLLIIGVSTEGMGCHQFLQLVRKYPTTGEVPVVALAAQRSDQAELAKLRDLGVKEFLRRPFTLRLLRDAVTRAHPDGPARAGGILGTSSSFELPPVEGPDPEQLSMEHDLPAEQPLEVALEPPGVAQASGSFLRPAATITVRVASGAAAGREVQVERYGVDQVVIRTRRFRLARDEELRLEVLRLEGEHQEQVRLLGRVSASRWALGGGRATVEISAALPLDGAAEVARWLADG